jgi:hypothetical protein
MLVARKMRVITRFEKKLLRFENVLQKQPAPQNTKLAPSYDNFFDFANDTDERDLLDNMDYE